MRRLFWWRVAVVGTAVVLAVLLALEGAPAANLIAALCAVGVLVVGWFILSRHAEDDRRYAVALMVLIVVTSGVGVAFYPTVAIIQTISFPLIWFFSGGTRTAVIANVFLAGAVSLGFLFSLGFSQQNLVQTAITEVISLGLSLALGFWFSHVYAGIDERQALIDKLETAQSKLATLSRDAGAASERERLALEIHDTIAQDLTGLVMTAQRGMRELRDGNTAAAESQLAILEENARNALAETRALVASGAAVGADGGLATALRRLGERFERETGIVVTVSGNDSATLDRDAEVVLLRCAQEALANVRKHSGATTASLTLVTGATGIALTIGDDGRGFDADVESTGFGLAGMRERLGLVRGTLEVTAAPGGGTTLVANLPASTGITA